MNDELHKLSKRETKSGKNNKEHYLTVVFHSKSAKYRKKEYYYKTEKDLDKGEKTIAPTKNSDKATAVVKRKRTRKPNIKPTIKEIK